MKIRKFYEIEVSYPTVANQAWNRFDDAIEKAAGRDRSSSGCGFGARDMQFLFCYEDAAIAAIERIRKIDPSIKVE